MKKSPSCRFMSSAFATIFALGIPGYAPGQSQSQPSAANASPIELRIAGPHLIRRGHSLKFHVEMINRSDKPITVRDHWLYGEATGFDWKITEAGGRVLPAPVHSGPPVFICPVTGPVIDRNITILKSGEKAEYSELVGDPSDSFVFKGKGFYRVSLRYTLEQTNQIIAWEYSPPVDAQGYTPQQKIALLKSMGYIEATSNEWQLYLTE